MALANASFVLPPREAMADVIIAVSNPGAQVPGRPASTILFSDIHVTLNGGVRLPTILVTSPGPPATPYVPLSSLAGNVSRTTVPGIDESDIQSIVLSRRRTAASTTDEVAPSLQYRVRPVPMGMGFIAPGLLDGLGTLLHVVVDTATYRMPPDIGTPLVFTGGTSAAVPDWTVYTSYDPGTGAAGPPFSGSATIDFFLAVTVTQVPAPPAIGVFAVASGLLVVLRRRRRP